jgi:hypothetical protein
LPALEWKFSARDFSFLVEKLQIFKTLATGNKNYDSLFNYCEFEKKKRTLFKEIFFSVVTRISESEAVSTIKIKTTGTTEIP